MNDFVPGDVVIVRDGFMRFATVREQIEFPDECRHVVMVADAQ